MRARPAPVAVALCLAVAGCSDGGGAAGPTLPPLTESPSASPSPDATALGVPSEATAATPDGASEFVRYFYAQVQAAYAQRNPALIASLVTADCEACSMVIKSVERLVDENLQVPGYRLTVTSATAPDVGDEPSTTVVVTLDSSEYVEIDAAGVEVFREAASADVTQSIALVRSGAAWAVSAVTTG